jgi:tRNA(Leu) C34 or U34 (ribose-2'-O)-methylase TrmL
MQRATSNGSWARVVRGKVESLNVSVATAIVLYEILRQRDGPG